MLCLYLGPSIATVETCFFYFQDAEFIQSWIIAFIYELTSKSFER